MVLTPSVLLDSPSLLIIGFKEASCHEFCCHKESNAVNNHISSETALSLVIPPDENSLLANILMATLCDSKQRTPLSCAHKFCI